MQNFLQGAARDLAGHADAGQRGDGRGQPATVLQRERYCVSTGSVTAIGRPVNVPAMKGVIKV